MKLGKILLTVVAIMLALTALGKSQPTSLFCVLEGTGHRITVFFLREASGGSFYVNGAKAQLALTSLDRPPEPHVLTATSGGTTISQIGAPCYGNSCAGRSFLTGRYYAHLEYVVPSNLRAGMYAVEIVGTDALRSADGAPLNPGHLYLPPMLYVPAISGDDGLRDARRRYLGKTVYAMPSDVETGRCAGDPTARVALNKYQAATITSIERSVGAVETGYFQNPNGAFLALDPLIVGVRTADNHFVMPPSLPAVIRLPKSGACIHRDFMLADPWEIERHFSLRDPREHPEWPARFQSALKQNTVLPGMTHEMVSSILGYPAAYGTIAQLDRLAVWSYDAPTPFQSTVYFRGDAVIKYNPPGNLP